MRDQCVGFRVGASVVFFMFLLTLQSFSSGFEPARSLSIQKNVESVLIKVVEQTSNRTVLSYSVPKLKLKTVSHQTRNGHNAIRLSMGNAELLSIPTEPEIPMVAARVILEQGQRIESLRVIPRVIEEMPGTYTLTYGEYPHPLIPGSKITWAAPDEAIYNSNVSYPEKTEEFKGMQHRFGVAIALINVYPVIPEKISDICLLPISLLLMLQRLRVSMISLSLENQRVLPQRLKILEP